MSLYDNFHAPQYVDFMNLQNYDASDSSAFFASNHDPTLTDNNDGCNSSMSSASSEDERTLTPGHCGSVMSESMSSDDSMSSVLAAPYKDDQVTGGLTSTPFATSPKCFTFDDHAMSIDHCQQLSASKTPTMKLRHEGTEKPYSRTSTSSLRSRTSNIISPLKVSMPTVQIIPPTPCKPVDDSSYKRMAPAPNVTSTCHSPSRNVPDKNRRRTKSVGSNQRSPRMLDESLILQEAIESLTLSSGPQMSNDVLKSPRHEMCVKDDNAETATGCSDGPLNSSPQCTTQVVNKPMKPCGREGQLSRPKRKLSPPRANSRDYSRQPEKYVGVVPMYNRPTVPSRAPLASTSSRKAEVLRKSKVCRQGLNAAPNHQASKDNGGAVKVPRWPAPKVEPFKLTEYKKKELPKTVFHFDKQDDVVLCNRRTPLKPLKKPTKVKPFSFDLKTQEIMQRKINRMNGIIDTGGHCCTQLRRRSKSAGAEITADKLVHHARPALVLQKPAFVPVKPKHHKITPCAFELSTERRAKEREQFEAELRCKEQERAHALNELREKQRQAEEKELLKMRHERAFKAHPMPAYPNFKPEPYHGPLTEPHGPKFNRSKQSNSHVQKESQ